MGDDNIWDELGKKADDKVRHNEQEKRYNELVDRYNEKAEIIGSKKHEKIDYNPMEHLKDEMVASSYKNTHYSNRDAEDLVRRLDPRKMMEALEKRQNQWREDARKQWEENERWEREHPVEAKKRKEEERERVRRLDQKRKFWITVSTILGGTIGGVGFAFFLTIGSGSGIVVVGSVTVFGITAFIMGYCNHYLRGFDGVVHGCGWGCGGIIVGMIVAFIVAAIVAVLGLELEGALGGWVVGTAGFLEGAFGGWMVGRAICY